MYHGIKCNVYLTIQGLLLQSFDFAKIKINKLVNKVVASAHNGNMLLLHIVWYLLLNVTSH